MATHTFISAVTPVLPPKTEAELEAEFDAAIEARYQRALAAIDELKETLATYEGSAPTSWAAVFETLSDWTEELGQLKGWLSRQPHSLLPHA